MKNQLQQLFQEIINDIGVKDTVVDIVMTENSNNGDYTTNVAMKLAKQLKKSPMDIALQVAKQVKSEKLKVESKGKDLNNAKDNQKISAKVAHQDVLQAIERVDVVAPGFINIFLTESKLGTDVSTVLKLKESYGTSHADAKALTGKQSKRVTIEFTDPNPFKEFHIGHLYSNSVGESLSRILEIQVHTVRRVNYQGDVGMHVAKALYGLLKISDLSSQLLQLKTQPLAERAKFLGSAYAFGAKAFEEDKIAAEEIKELNKLGFIVAQDMWVKEKGIPPIINYRTGSVIDQIKLDHLSSLYTLGRSWSLEYFETIYKRLGTTFAGYYFESFVGEKGAQTVREHISDGIFEESDGAVIYRGEKKGLHTRVFINALGLPTYEAKELGLAPAKYHDWPYDLSIIVTGNEINEYFKVLLAALSEIAPELASKTRHIGHGMVRKSDGSKMSSRSGIVLSGEGLLDEVKASISALIDKNKSNYTKEEHENIAEKAAVAAVKYSLLRVSLPSDVAFDISTSVSFDGDSGPYLLYTYARCRSVLVKAEKQIGLINPINQICLIDLNVEERSLARLIHFYPQIVADSATNFAPSTLCKYLFELASAFNSFYAKYKILGESDDIVEKRLVLTAATAQVLKNGLYLLGIETVERM